MLRSGSNAIKRIELDTYICSPLGEVLDSHLQWRKQEDVEAKLRSRTKPRVNREERRIRLKRARWGRARIVSRRRGWGGGAGGVWRERRGWRRWACCHSTSYGFKTADPETQNCEIKLLFFRSISDSPECRSQRKGETDGSYIVSYDIYKYMQYKIFCDNFWNGRSIVNCCLLKCCHLNIIFRGAALAGVIMLALLIAMQSLSAVSEQ